jgi:hypothetical protein
LHLNPPSPNRFRSNPLRGCVRDYFALLLTNGVTMKVIFAVAEANMQ